MASGEQTSSFRKKARVKIGQIQGTRPSLYNNQLLISTGIPSLDSFIGGGLAVGTVLLLEEDVYGTYTRLMLKYYLAEAVLTKQSIFIASADENTEKLIKELPASVNSDTQTAHPASSSNVSPETSAAGDKDEKMKIAWRYQNQRRVQAPPSISQFGHYYDLTRTMDPGLLDPNLIFHSRFIDRDSSPSPSHCPAHMNQHYQKLLLDIRDRIRQGGFSTSHQAEKRSILRIGIHSLGSPLWDDDCSTANDEGGAASVSLMLFLLALRAELRSALASAMITVPSHLFQDKAVVQRIERLCDTVVKIESFAGSEKEKNPVFKDYHGLVHVIQIPRLNSLVPAQLETPDLAFKLRRKKFTIERLHLPPELSFSEFGGGGDSTKGSACGSSSSSSKLDF
ncbi:hypothetical protein EGW08_020312 [Elysia chlorotica]|uniref:Elongator complex protein 4 n=1 Tax=Elysia chlorotica TaxID=188477 RepID=A0A433SRL9_ELYCH|nr:hypothetical protein EGW08_020312 [Elysia chlorotica]